MAAAGVTPGVVVAGVVEAALVTGWGPFSIFSVFGPWTPSRASRRTTPPIAIFFCLASFAFSGSTRFAITPSPRFLLPRCLRAAEPPRPPLSPVASPPRAEPSLPDVSSPYTYAFSFSVAASSGKPRSDSEKSTLATEKSRPAACSSPRRTVTSVRSRKRKSESA